jgi:hypothetical protein
MNTPSYSALLKAAGLTAPKRRELVVTPRILDEAKGIVRYTASDETLDCYNEIVRAAGWQFTFFSKNAPFVDSHDYSTIKNLLGQVVDFRVNGNALEEDVAYSREPGTLAEWAFKMVRDGFLRAVSVGFIPLSTASRYDRDRTSFQEQIDELGLDAQSAAKLSCVYLRQEQLELSQCVLGANPNALAKAYKGGTLSEEDIDKLSVLIANTKNAAPAAVSADAGAASPRTKLAILAAIQTQL